MARIPSRPDMEEEAILELQRRESEEVREQLRKIRRKKELLDEILERKRKAREEREKQEELSSHR